MAAEAAARAAIAAELVGLRATRTFRYTAELRSAYGRLRKIANPPEPTPPEPTPSEPTPPEPTPPEPTPSEQTSSP